jgi:hypothetical protein
MIFIIAILTVVMAFYLVRFPCGGKNKDGSEWLGSCNLAYLTIQYLK